MNWGNAFSLTNPLTGLQKLLISLAVGAGIYAAGYATCYHNNAVDQAETTGRQEGADTVMRQTVIVTDKAAVDRLTAQVEAEKQRADSFQKRLKDASHATPATDACRLPDELRDEINARLGADQRDPSGTVRGIDRPAINHF